MRLESPHDLDIDDAVTLEIREEPLHRLGIRYDFTLRCNSHPSARSLIEVQQPNHTLSVHRSAHATAPTHQPCGRCCADPAFVAT